jgi:hypothetical protein
VGRKDAVNKYMMPGLFMCWPEYAADWAYKALMRFQGDHLVYVGEGYGGCTADDNFHKELNENWDEVQLIALPQWFGLHDYLSIHKRKAPIIHARKVIWK